MITGGLGFIGSNLAWKLVDLGARVLIVDSLIDDYGGNLFNICGLEDRLRVNIADVRQQTTMNYLVRGQDVIFNLAGQVSHIDSMRDPYTDLDINCRAQLSILEACRNSNPAVKIVFAGTRQVYGRADSLPVSESHLVRPTDVNGINKAAGEYYHLLYNNVFGVRACSLRLTNVYGPRQLLKHNRQGFIAWFIRLAIEDREIQIYGDGSQLRDFVYVDDAADAFLRAGADEACNGQVLNVGGIEPIAHRDLVQLLIQRRRLGAPSIRRVAAGEEGHRHRRLLRRFDTHQADARMDAAHQRSPMDCRRRSTSFANTSIATCRHPSPHPRVVTEPTTLPFLDLRLREDAAAVRDAIARVTARGWYVLGPEVEAFESEFAAASGATFAVGTGTGTDAIALLLRAAGIGAEDEVIVPAITAAYTALAVIAVGRQPGDRRRGRRDADDGSGGVRGGDHVAHARDRARCTCTVRRPTCRRSRPSPRVTSWPSSKTAARRISRRARGVPVGTFGVGGAFSFYPTKNLGALGDGGAAITNDRGSGGACQAAAERRSDRALRARRGGHQQPARRDAGGRSPCAAAAAAANGRDRRREIGTPVPPVAARPGSRRSWSAIPVTSITCFPCGASVRQACRRR